MMLFPAIGLLLWVALLLVALVLVGLIWLVRSLILWLTDPMPLQPRLTSAPASKPQASPVRTRPEAQMTSELWPKWTASRREYVDRELSLWQEQFDALAARRYGAAP